MALTGLTNLQPLHIKTVGIGTFDNTVSIGGTLTYEDVTNVDAIGIITARSGVNVSGGQLDVGSNIKLGNAGVITATSFVGSGANLTGLPAGITINGNADNRVITGSGTANTLEADANLTWNNSTGQLVVGASGSGYISVRKPAIAQVDIQHSTTNSYSRLYMSQSSGSGGYFAINKLGTVDAGYTGGANAVQLWSSADAPMIFATNNNERVRITQSGQLFIGTTSGSELLCLKRNDTVGPTITLENNANKTYINNWGSTGGGGSGSGRTNRFEINATLASQASYCAPFHTFMTGGTENNYEKVRITSDGRLLINSTAVVNTDDFLTIKRPAGNTSVTSMTVDATTTTATYANALIFTKSKDYYFNGLVFTSSGGHQGGIAAKMTVNGGSTPEIQMRIGGSSFNQSDTLAMSVHNTGTVQAHRYLTHRNGIVQINQVTSTTRYSGSINSVDLITGSTFSPKTSAPSFLIMIFCPVNTSDDSDAMNQNTNQYAYGRIEYRKSGGGWIECNNQGSTAQQGGQAAHIEMSPNRTGNDSGDYHSGDRYRMEHKCSTIFVTNVGDCGASGTVQFKLRGYASNQGNFIQIGQPHGNGTDDNYSVMPWGFTVFELAPDSNSYTAY